MESTAEYIVLSLQDPWAVHDNLFHHYRSVREEQKQGHCNRYYSVRANSFYIPHREIFTYLASKLFEKSGDIRKRIPTKVDVDHFAITTLARGTQNITSLYNALYSELCEGFDDCYCEYLEDWRFVREYGDRELLACYTRQTAAKQNILEQNAKNMLCACDPNSLLGRVDMQLRNLIRNIDYGPMYAYGLVSVAESHNLINVIDSLIQENTSRWDQEASMSSLRTENCGRAKADFENRRRRGILDSNAKRFADYEYYLMLLETHKLALICYARMDGILTQLRTQVEKLAEHYCRFHNMVDTFFHTCEKNLEVLSCPDSNLNGNHCSFPFVSLSEIKGFLDEEISKTDVTAIFDQLMQTLLDNDKCWYEKEMAEFFDTLFGNDGGRMDKKISPESAINNFFTETVFEDFLNIPVIAAARHVLDHPWNEESNSIQLLSDRIYHRVISGESSWDRIRRSFWSNHFVILPEKLSDFKNPMHTRQFYCRTMHGYSEKLYTVHLDYGIAPWFHKDAEQWMVLSNSQMNVCGHLYENPTFPGMPFSDWRNLPQLIPVSQIQAEKAPYKVRETAQAVTELYRQAVSYGVIRKDGEIWTYDQEWLEQRNKLLRQTEQYLAQKVGKDMCTAETLLAQIKDTSGVMLVPSGLRLPKDGHSAHRETILLDYLGLSPVMQETVAEICKRLSDEQQKAAQLFQNLEAYLTACVGEKTQVSRDNFFEALFTGVLTVEGRKIYYKSKKDSTASEVVLTERNPAFPFYAIPVYQGYLSYQQRFTYEEKEMLRQEVHNIFDTNPGQLKKTLRELKLQYDNKFSAFITSATMFDEADVIIYFLRNFHQKLKELCASCQIF